MEIIEELCKDLIRMDVWQYGEYTKALLNSVDETKKIYELVAPWNNWRGIRCRKVFWTDKQGQPRSCEITQTAIIFNGG